MMEKRGKLLNIFLLVFVMIFALIVRFAEASEIHEAARKGDLATVKKLLEQGGNFNETDKDGNMPIQIAAAKGNIEIVRFLTEYGASLNKKSKVEQGTNVQAKPKDNKTVAAKISIENNDNIVIPLVVCSGGKIPVSEGAQANERADFVLVNCEVQKEIRNIRFFFLESRYGLFGDPVSHSPLSDSQIGVGYVAVDPPYQSACGTIVVQNILTRPNAMYFLEGALFHQNVFNAIYRNIPRIPILYKLLHSLIGLVDVVLSLIGELLVKDIHKNLFSLVVDNSFDHDIYFHLDIRPPLKIPAKKQTTVVFKEGLRNVKISQAPSGDSVESFTVNCTKTQTASCGIYNVSTNNSYKVIHVQNKF